MATHPNRLTVTQAPTRRSFKSQKQGHANASNRDVEELDAEGESGYRVRSEAELSEAEKLCLDTLDDAPTDRIVLKLDFANLFHGPKTQLETWPLFYQSKEESGIEMQQGLVTLWSNFLIAETLMASISIQPLVTVPDVAHGWKLKLYGYIWMMSMISDVWGIAITALFLGYLLGCPNKVAWNWMCKIGWLRSIPSILVFLDTILTLIAIAYTCWILYGYQMGIVCAMVEFFFVGTCLKLSAFLNKARDKVTEENMQYKVTTPKAV